MIRHIVFIKFKENAKKEDIRAVEKGLGALPGIISEIREYEFGRDVLKTERSYDFALISAFEDIESLKRYQVHPEHQVVVGKIKVVAEDVLAVDYRVD